MILAVSILFLYGAFSLKAPIAVPFFEIKRIASEVGLDVTAVSLAKPKSQDATRLKVWQEKGHAANMAYMMRDADLQSDPLRLLPEAKTVLSFAVAYDTRPAPVASVGYGRVARYAWGRDYHLLLPERLEAFIAKAKIQFGNFNYRYFSDAVPLLERAFAASSGLGFIGKNTLLIRPRLGSFTLLAEILWDLHISDFQIETSNSSCGSCQKCMESCPTSAFESEYVLDARKCISYLSIEKKGILSLAERNMLGEWIFGCDVCQEVCPYNHTSLKQGRAPSLEEFSADFGVGPLLSLKEVVAIKDQQEFKLRFKDTPVMRAKREGLVRNAICVAVNTGAIEISKQLQVLALEDASALVRQFAYWGVFELDKREGGQLSSSNRRLLELGFKDTSEAVRAEVSGLLD